MPTRHMAGTLCIRLGAEQTVCTSVQGEGVSVDGWYRSGGHGVVDEAHVLDVGECPYFLAVPDHRHVLQSCVMDLCLFLDILDITD
jgi:hypothetical protein